MATNIRDITYKDRQRPQWSNMHSSSQIEKRNIKCPPGFENGKLYVAQHVRKYNQECEAMRSQENTFRPGPGTMEDVSTIDFNHSQYEGSVNEVVYRNYNFTRNPEFNKILPIHEYEKEILDKINLYDVIVIEGETGCGKSTQVPQFILDDAARKNEYANIVVTQPRKIAAIMLANRVINERNWTSLCSYQVGLDNQTNFDTRITYMTTEVLVQKIIHKKSLSLYTHIILDEVHERDSHTDFALLIVKKLLHTVSDPVKIILMSATIDAMKFSRYFASPHKGFTIPAPIITISQRKSLDYKIFYYDHISDGSSYTDPWVCPDTPTVTHKMIECCISIIKRFDNFECLDENEPATEKLSENRQSILIFLPGLRQIEQLVSHLRPIQELLRFDLLPLHSSITKAEQNKVLDPPRKGFRKIILSTNIAESSLTIPDISYVIDFCLTKTLYCDKDTNYTSLKLNWASKASCKQRAGRVGRTGPGRVYRLVSKEFFEGLESYGTPELTRTSLTECVLKVKMLDMGSPEALLALALDPPDLSEIHRTILVLKQIGALSVKTKGIVSAIDGNLTFIGRVACSLPLDVRVSKLIVFGYLLGCFKQTITIAAGLSLKNMFSRPFQYELPAHMGKISFAEESHSDCIAILNAYDLWCKAKSEAGHRWPAAKEKIWAQKQYLQIDVLREMAKLIAEITRRLVHHNLEEHCNLAPYDSMQQHLRLKICIAAAFYPYYFKQSREENQDVDKYLAGMDPFSVALISHLPDENTFLYEAQLKELFTPCSHDLDFTFNGTKAVMYLVKKAQPGVKCAQENPNTTILQLALKMKQIPRIAESLRVREIESAELKNNKDCRDIRRIPSAMVPAPHIPGWKIFVTHVENAAHFWAANLNNIDSEYNLSVTNIENIIKAELPGCSYLNPQEIVSKVYCLAPFYDGSRMSHYRARIESVRPNSVTNERTALIFYLDYGNCEEISVKSLKTLPDSLYKIPQLSIEFILSGIQPLNSPSSSNNHGWSQMATEFTTQQIIYSINECQIYSITNNVVRGKLFIEGQLLNDILVEKKWAKVVEESVDSKLNHHLREMSTRIGNKKLESLVAHDSTHASTYQYDIKLSEKTKKFRGPFTPLEMTFHGLSRSLSSHRMVIQMNSVNSTALDLDYDNKHSKFIVSAFVSMNEAETVLFSSDTTLMPGIPGLMEICLLMFSPCGELRVSKDNVGYSGAVVGLPIKDEYIYKSEDIEICFDFKLTNEDILQINIIRNCLNICLGDMAQVNHLKIPVYQKTLQETIKELLLKNREYQKPEDFERQLQWNCIEMDKLIIASTENDDEYQPTYALLNSVQLYSTINNEANKEKVLDLYHRYSDLNRTKQIVDSREIDEVCVLCNVQLRTYGDLDNHMREPDHVSKENKALELE